MKVAKPEVSVRAIQRPIDGGDPAARFWYLDRCLVKHFETRLESLLLSTFGVLHVAEDDGGDDQQKAEGTNRPLNDWARIDQFLIALINFLILNFLPWLVFGHIAPRRLLHVLHNSVHTNRLWLVRGEGAHTLVVEVIGVVQAAGL